MELPWKIVKKTWTPADERLEQIKDILFPKLRLAEKFNGDRMVKYHIDYSIDSNLDAALVDLIEGNNDEIAHSTINKAISKLHRVRKLLEAHMTLDKNAEYIIVDTEDRHNKEIENIVAAKEHKKDFS